MRTRTRYWSSFGNSFLGHTQTWKSTGALYSSNSYNEGSFNTHYDVIMDRITNKRTKEDRAKLARRLAIAERLLSKSEQASVKADLWSGLMTTNPCVHTKLRLLPIKGTTVIRGSSSTLNHDFTYQDFGGINRHVAGSTATSKLTNFAAMASINSANPFHDHDWFALLDQWHESCNNLITPDTNIGESIVENGIFVDAFKTVLNPSRGLKYLLEFVKGNLGNKKYSGLGKVGRLLRDTSDASLTYKFGVKPAMEEIKRMLQVTSLVSSRMAFLRANVGGYIPVRARQLLPSSVEDPADSLFDGNGVVKQLITRESIAVISALAKVRPDLTYAGDWQAYIQYFGLHKVFGLGWELIPFSFVIDWVTNAQEYVNKYMTPKYDGPFMNMRNITHSTRKSTRYALVMKRAYRWSSWSATRPSGSEPVELGYLTETEYVRNPGLPTTSGSVDFSRLGLFHGITSGSLLLQKAGGLFKKS